MVSIFTISLTRDCFWDVIILPPNLPNFTISSLCNSVGIMGGVGRRGILSYIILDDDVKMVGVS